MSEKKYSKKEAAELTIEIDVDGVREGLQRVLAKPKAAEFLRELIRLASEIAAKNNPDNTLVEEGDLIRIYNMIQQQGKMRREAPTGAPGYIARRTAGITIGFISTLPESATLAELEALYLGKDILFALHETLHHAGTLTYSDEDYARAVAQIVGDDFDEKVKREEGDDEEKWKYKCSNYWGKELKKRCRPN